MQLCADLRARQYIYTHVHDPTRTHTISLNLDYSLGTRLPCSMLGVNICSNEYTRARTQKQCVSVGVYRYIFT